jgi:hypothetical protein
LTGLFSKPGFVLCNLEDLPVDPQDEYPHSPSKNVPFSLMIRSPPITTRPKCVASPSDRALSRPDRLKKETVPAFVPYISIWHHSIYFFGNGDGFAMARILKRLLFVFYIGVILVSTAQGLWAAPGGRAVFNITDYGAKNDGSAAATEAFRQAIQAARSAGGGTIYVPAGRYTSGPIELFSNMTLVIDAGAVVDFPATLLPFTKGRRKASRPSLLFRSSAGTISRTSPSPGGAFSPAATPIG